MEAALPCARSAPPIFPLLVMGLCTISVSGGAEVHTGQEAC